MLRVISFTGDLILARFVAQDVYELARWVELKVKTTEGVLWYDMMPGFRTNMRSGSHVIDPLIPKFTGNNRYNLALLGHDFNYNLLANGSNPVSRLVADRVLMQMAMQSGEIGWLKARAMYLAVRAFGGGAYESDNAADDGGLYKDNAKFMRFRWDTK
jgi:hypothetical protein